MSSSHRRKPRFLRNAIVYGLLTEQNGRLGSAQRSFFLLPLLFLSLHLRKEAVFALLDLAAFKTEWNQFPYCPFLPRIGDNPLKRGSFQMFSKRNAHSALCRRAILAITFGSV